MTSARQRTRRFVETARLSLGAATKAARDVCVSEYVAARHASAFAEDWSLADNVPGWLGRTNAAALFDAVLQQKPRTIVEIGSFLGRSTVLLALAAKRTGVESVVVAVDPHTGDRQQLERLGTNTLPSLALFQEHCRAAGVADIIRPVVATSEDAAKDWCGDIDLLYVDGWHSYDAVIEDGRAWLPYLVPSGMAIFDDYVAYPEVSRAVHDLTLVADFHLWGNLFGQAIGGKLPTPVPPVRRSVRAARLLQPLYRQAETNH